MRCIPEDDEDVAARGTEEAAHQFPGDASGLPVVRTDVSDPAAVRQVGDQRHDRNPPGNKTESVRQSRIVGAYDD